MEKSTLSITLTLPDTGRSKPGARSRAGARPGARARVRPGAMETSTRLFLFDAPPVARSGDFTAVILFHN